MNKKKLPPQNFYFGYFGNKWKELPFILPFIDLTNVTTIVEPFCGSGSFSYYLWNDHNSNPKQTFHLNDVDPLLMDFLQYIPTHKQAVHQFLKDHYGKISKEDYLELVKPYIGDREAPSLPLDRLERNAQFLLSRTHIHHTYGRFTSSRPFPTYTKLQKPLKYDAFLTDTDNVLLTCQSFETVLKQYHVDDKALLFIDPPYHHTANIHYYENGKELETNIYLPIQTYLNTCQCHVIMTVNDTELMRDLFSKWIKGSYDVTYAKSKKVSTVLVIVKQ